MALWGISTTTETAANNYALPKHLTETDRNNTPWNCFADERGWIYRRYGTTENSGLSTNYYDEVLVPVAGLNTTGIASNTTGLGAATPVAVFFEDPSLSNPISVGANGAAGIAGIGTGTTGYVHVVYNELVYTTAGAQIGVVSYTGAGVKNQTIVAYASSIARGASVFNFINNVGYVTFTNYNGQVTNRVAFAFTAPVTGIGSYLAIEVSGGVTGVVTDLVGGTAAIKTLTADLLRNVAGAGTTIGVGIGSTMLRLRA
jgi:hypothetical protein